ncbi:thiolase domain-containing protein [Hwanghaeella grinnelliae]|uniref:Thiolase domain-containing protein n=1 Tax=Hwanghaeella grinnelliae TaxID=2500179 RepID=A0A3S2VL47_9PROT|nr:acetyl-CoA acetyltransferase [Hwanghaeella grinnelliae]RVU34746.1 thiolase domain-containing protein [Hwanghaeella grinnelliae]
MTACIIGWHHSKFGKLEDDSVESLIVDVAAKALKDAEMDPRDIDAIYLGFYNGGFSAQDFGSSLVMNGIEGLRWKPSTRVENACATGSAAVHQGVNFIEAKQGRNVLVVGVEKMTDTKGPRVGEILLSASYVKEEAETEGGFAGVFGQIASTYFQKYGDQSDALATIAAKNHKNGAVNPMAQMQKDLGYDFCRNVSEKNPVVAGPLKRTDCSLVSDGAAALVLTDVETAMSKKKAVVFRARNQVNDYLPMSKRDMTYLTGCQKAWEGAFEKAGMTLDDLDLVETHDCFTIAELMQYEAMGLTAPGEGSKAALEGWTQKDGKLPVNASGGLKAKGHPIGATGVSMHVLTAMQVRGEAGGIQVDGAKVGGVFNMGGAAVANYCSILEAIR